MIISYKTKEEYDKAVKEFGPKFDSLYSELVIFLYKSSMILRREYKIQIYNKGDIFAIDSIATKRITSINELVNKSLDEIV